MTSGRPVVIVGAGLAGLACALRLRRHGMQVLVLEAGDRVGGVLRTDRVDGFRLDRGFQVLQTGYPEARALLDLAALRLYAFDHGAITRRGGRFRSVFDPLRHPLRAGRTLASGVISPADAWRTLVLRHSVTTASLEELMGRPATSTRERLARAGFSSTFRESFLEPFYRGVMLEPALQTSSRIFDFTFRMFASGPVALPKEGIAAIPAQLAGRLPAASIQLEAAVDGLTSRGVRLADGGEIDAAGVVVATDAETAARWLPEVPTPRWNVVGCVYFGASRAPIPGPQLILDGDSGGPVNHVCFPSEVCADYAPKGRALASVTILGDSSDSDDETVTNSVRDQLRDWWGTEVDDWEPLRVDRIQRAIPFQGPREFEPATRPVRIAAGRYVCGGHRETSSIGGALRSGRRAADALIADLGSRG